MLNPTIETVSATPNDPKDLVAHDATKGKGLEPSSEGMVSSLCGGDTCHEQFTPAVGAQPVRMRHNKPEGGSHVTSETSVAPEHPHKAQDPGKVAKFTRGGEGRVAYPGVSSRDWNNDDKNAPNTKAV